MLTKEIMQGVSKAEAKRKGNTAVWLEQDGDLWAVRADFQGFEPIDDSELDQRFKDWLDEVYGDISIAGLEYPTSKALKEVDEVAYRVTFTDWLDAEIRDNSIKEWNGLYWVQS